ncbi:DedA family protein [Nonomuraea sp. NPDC049158]|uniref:DedA family protein n=1 Tax=Nonomuraea sp. NPDC049158 TaxID=3155649 RepID=UPI00340276FC
MPLVALSNVLDWWQSLPEPALIAGAGVIALGESIIGIGFFLPAQAALMIASATVDSLPEFLILWAVVTVGAVAGNVIGFELGRRVGPALRETKLVKKRGAKGWDKATVLLRKHGRWAVFVGRLIPIGLVQSVVPAVAGAAHMRYRTFLPPMAAGAACSTAIPLLIGIGVAAGLKDASGIVLIIVGALLALVAVFVIRKRRRAKTTTTDTSPHDSNHGPDPDREPAHRA